MVGILRLVLQNRKLLGLVNTKLGVINCNKIPNECPIVELLRHRADANLGRN